MMYKFTLILAVFCLLSASCSRSIIQPAIIEKTIVKDSIIEIVRDSIVTLPADSSWVKAYLECDSIGKVHIKQLIQYETGKNIKPPVLTIRENILIALSGTDSINIYLALKDRYHEKTTDKVIYEKEIVEVNRLSKWQNFWIILGRISAVLFGGIFIFSIRKIF